VAHSLSCKLKQGGENNCLLLNAVTWKGRRDALSLRESLFSLESFDWIRASTKFVKGEGGGILSYFAEKGEKESIGRGRGHLYVEAGTARNRCYGGVRAFLFEGGKVPDTP